MEAKPSKGKIAGLAAVVAAVSALMAWALVSAFNADQSRFGGLNEDAYNDDYEPPLEPEAVAPESDVNEGEPAVKKPEAPSAAMKAEPAAKTEPAKPKASKAKAP